MEKDKKKKGFTLIELLAVILVLGVVVLVAVPVVSDIIESSEVRTVTSSAQGYIDAVNEKIAVIMMDGNIEDGVYTVEDLNDLGITVSGDVPLSGRLVIQDGTVKEYELEYEEYVAVFQDSKLDVDKKDDNDDNDDNDGPSTPTQKPNREVIVGVSPEYVYFNPETGSKCTQIEYQININSVVSYNPNVVPNEIAYSAHNTVTLLAVTKKDITGGSIGGKIDTGGSLTPGSGGLIDPGISGGKIGDDDSGKILTSTDGKMNDCLQWLKLTSSDNSYELILTNGILGEKNLIFTGNYQKAEELLNEAYTITDRILSSWSSDLFNLEYNNKYRFVTAEEIAKIFSTTGLTANFDPNSDSEIKNRNLLGERVLRPITEVSNPSAGELYPTNYTSTTNFLTSTIYSKKIENSRSVDGVWMVEYKDPEINLGISASPAGEFLKPKEIFDSQIPKNSELSNVKVDIRPVIKVSKSLID